MKFLRAIIFAATAISFCPILQAVELNLQDCIIQGMKGVNSDLAARLVKSSCEEKKIEQEKTKEKDAKDKFESKNGFPILEDNLIFVKWHQISSSKGLVSFKNTTNKSLNISYARFHIYGLDDKGYCAYENSYYTGYDTFIAPSEIGDFEFPLPEKNASRLCFYIDHLRAKSFDVMDKILSKLNFGAYKPLESDSLENERRLQSAPAATPIGSKPPRGIPPNNE